MRLTRSLFWYAYLALLGVISLHSQRFDTAPWLGIATLIYSFAGVYALAIAGGMACNWRALHKARYVIGLSALSLLWLWIQTVWPDADKSQMLFQDQTPAPAWFQPSTVISITPDKTRWLMWSGLLVWVWLVLSIALLDSRRRLKQFLWIVMLTGALHAVVGVVAALNVISLVDVRQVDGHFHNARGWFVNRNHFSAFVLLTLLGTVTLLLRSRGMKRGSSQNYAYWLRFVMSWRIFPSLILLASLVALVQSGSRAGMASLAVLLLVFAGVYQWRDGNLIRHWKLASAVMLVTLIVVIAFGDLLLPRISAEALSLGERSVQWRLTLPAIVQAPISGWGGGSYGTVFQAIREFAPLRGVVYNQSHNEYLHILLEQGLTGLILWLAMLGLTARALWQGLSHQRSSLVRHTLIMSAVVLGAALMQAGVDFNLQIINIRCYFFAIIALVFTAPTVHKHPRRATQVSDTTLA